MTNFWKTLKKPITALAPMDGVTDLVFRELIATIAKPDVLFTEFTSSDALSSHGKVRAEKKLKYTEIQRPIAAQIWGTSPENFKYATQQVEKLGFDGIDINMGCPDRAVMKKGSGAALINNKELAKEIINAVKEGSPKLPLSVKTRLDTTSELTKEWILFLLSQKIDALIIHGRTAKAMSKGAVDWEEIKKAVELKNKLNPNIIVLGNGNVESYNEVIEKSKNYGVDGIMIGRGIFNNPWVFDKNTGNLKHTKSQYIELLLAHAKLFSSTWGDTKYFESLKKFFKMYVNGFKGASVLRQRLMTAKNYKEVSEIINTSIK